MREAKIDLKKIKQDDEYPILKVNMDSNINFIHDSITLNKIVDFFTKLNKKYTVLWSAGSNDFEFVINSFDENDKKYIEDIKKYIKTLKFITKFKIALTLNSKDNGIIL